MRAGWRFGIAAIVAAAIFGSAPALAQDAVPATNTATPPAAETVGPRELRDFTINGTVTRPAPPPERSPQPTATTPRPRTPAQTAATATTATTPPPRQRPSAAPNRVPAGQNSQVTRSPPASDPLAPFTINGPAPADAPTVAQPDLEQAPIEAPVAPAQTGQNSFIPWLLALLALAGGGALVFWRQRSQPSYATASAGAFQPPEPQTRPEPLQRAPAPRPEPAPRPAPAGQPAVTAVPQPAPRPVPQRAPSPSPAAPFGVVSTSLRPWLDIEFTPGRCVVGHDKATIQFDVTVFNSGSAPARDVLIEASMFNAGPTQDQEIGAFFAHPETKGDRIPAIPPLKRVALKSAVSLTREQLRQFDVAGRKLFVPLIGVNALYRWSGGEGQTSASYVVGRDTQAEKMAPLRLDLGPRIFRGLGARRHDASVRN